MDGKALDLLALPIVAIEKTLCFMPPTDLLKISRASERCKELIKNIKFNIKLESYGYGVYVGWRGGYSSFGFKPKNEAMKEQELRDAVTEITRLYRTSLSFLSVETKDFEKTWKWIEEEQNGLGTLQLTDMTGKDPRKTIKTLLDNGELTELVELNINIYTSPSFKFEDPFIFKNTPVTLWLENATWFTLQNLMDSKVEDCRLYNSCFTDKDINAILKEWMNDDGCLSDLNDLELFLSYRVNYDIAFEGFQRERELVVMNSSTLRLTCDKEFFFNVTDNMRDEFRIKKKYWSECSD